ncbi:unnamed protein product [Trichogramma brassicae]|uniref:Endonuclease/exonuclease/phosphatase domain-containing protein n=1 Tax=Trichogramma brassicae TaxID=86971 RepID=A0A6H5HV71_9HYME|nr:unnamed protein product [Trichogramma brassicae]
MYLNFWWVFLVATPNIKAGDHFRFSSNGGVALSHPSFPILYPCWYIVVTRYSFAVRKKRAQFAALLKTYSRLPQALQIVYNCVGVLSRSMFRIYSILSLLRVTHDFHLSVTEDVTPHQMLSTLRCVRTYGKGVQERALLRPLPGWRDQTPLHHEYELSTRQEAPARYKMTRILQLNLNHCMAAQSLLMQSVKKMKIDVAILCDQHRDLRSPHTWISDADSQVAIWCGEEFRCNGVPPGKVDFTPGRR